MKMVRKIWKNPLPNYSYMAYIFRNFSKSRFPVAFRLGAILLPEIFDSSSLAVDLFYVSEFISPDPFGTLTPEISMSYPTRLGACNLYRSNKTYISLFRNIIESWLAII